MLHRKPRRGTGSTQRLISLHCGRHHDRRFWLLGGIICSSATTPCADVPCSGSRRW
jgi:hypothetical protein